jgi:pimeloyl-ACP methyl ester carboxylesterase
MLGICGWSPPFAMKRIRILLVKALLGLLAAALLAAAGALTGLSVWRSGKLAHLEAASAVAQTSKGAVEYQARGDGPAVLVLHGGFGGYDQGMMFLPGLAQAGFQVIAPSRPGYLRTPLSTGITNEEQADAMAALLDTLGVRRAAVVGISAGGPVALQFALRHPARTEALILVCAITKKTPPLIARQNSLARQWALHSRVLVDLASWHGDKVTREEPRQAMAFAFSMCSRAPSEQRARLVDGVLSDPEQRALFNELSGSTVPLGARLPGIRNDLIQITGLSDQPFEQVRAPTLIVHGTADKAVKISHAHLAAARIPQATLCQLEGADHLLMLGPRRYEVMRAVTGFLRDHLPACLPPGGSTGTPLARSGSGNVTSAR